MGSLSTILVSNSDWLSCCCLSVPRFDQPPPHVPSIAQPAAAHLLFAKHRARGTQLGEAEAQALGLWDEAAAQSHFLISSVTNLRPEVFKCSIW